MILKRFDPAHDLTMALPPVGEVREIALWRAGVFDPLPPPIGHAIVGAWREEGFWILAMRDLSAATMRRHCALRLALADFRVLEGFLAFYVELLGALGLPQAIEDSSLLLQPKAGILPDPVFTFPVVVKAAVVQDGRELTTIVLDAVSMGTVPPLHGVLQRPGGAPEAVRVLAGGG